MEDILRVDFQKLSFPVKYDELYIVKPLPWDGNPIPASGLKFEEHFRKIDLMCPSDVIVLKDFIEKIVSSDDLDWLKGPLATLNADIRRSRSCLYVDIEEEEFNEREIVFAFVDPLLRALHDATGCVYKLEEPVKMSDFLMLENIDELKELQEKVSQRSRSDVVVYHVKGGRYQKLIIVEIKSDETISRDSVAQAIGYYLASNAPSTYVQIALVISGSRAYLLLFPFRDRHKIYSEAIATPEIDLKIHYISVYKFICLFIKSNESAGIPKLKWSSCGLTEKATYGPLILAEQEYKDLSQQKLSKLKREKEAAEREKKVERQLREAAEREKEAAEREKEAAEREKEAAEREKEAAERAAKREIKVERQLREAAEREKEAAEKKINELMGLIAKRPIK